MLLSSLVIHCTSTPVPIFCTLKDTSFKGKTALVEKVRKVEVVMELMASAPGGSTPKAALLAS